MWRLIQEFASGATAIMQAFRTGLSQTLEVSVAVPASTSALGQRELETELSRVITERSNQVGVPQNVAVRVTPSPTDDAPRVVASIAGRPAAIVRAPTNDREDWSSVTAASIDRVVLRRLSLLVRPSDNATHAARLARLLDDVDRADCYRPVSGYLLDNGISLRNESLDPQPHTALPGRSSPEIAEVLIAAAAPRTITLQIPESILRRATDSGARSVLCARQRLYAATGLQFPDLTLALVDNAAEARVKLNDVWLTCRPQSAAPTWEDVVGCVESNLREHASWFVNMTSIQESREQLGAVLPDIVRLGAQRYPDQLIAAVVRCLVRNGDSIRNFPRIMWLLLESAPGRNGSWGSTVGGGDCVQFSEPSLVDPVDVPHDPELLAAHVRQLIEEEAWRARSNGKPPAMKVLPVDLEDELVDGADDQVDAALEWRIINALASSRPQPLVVSHSRRALRQLQYIAEAMEHRPRVISAQELPPGVELASA